jgi:hypothetical protein
MYYHSFFGIENSVRMVSLRAKILSRDENNRLQIARLDLLTLNYNVIAILHHSVHRCTRTRILRLR